VLAGGHDCLFESEQVGVVDLGHLEGLARGAAPDDDAPAPVQVDTTYSRCCSIGVFLRREGVACRAPSVSALGPSPRGRTSPLPINPPPGHRREQSRRTTGSTRPGRACGKRRCSRQRRSSTNRSSQAGHSYTTYVVATPIVPFGGRRRPAPPGTVTRERRCAPSSHQKKSAGCSCSHRTHRRVSTPMETEAVGRALIVRRSSRPARRFHPTGRCHRRPR